MYKYFAEVKSIEELRQKYRMTKYSFGKIPAVRLLLFQECNQFENIFLHNCPAQDRFHSPLRSDLCRANVHRTSCNLLSLPSFQLFPLCLKLF